MEIILSKQVESLTGSLGRGFGYAIRPNGKRFYSKRNSKGIVPYDGHWRFILACASLAKNKLHIVDILVAGAELRTALEEASHFIARDNVDTEKVYHADDIINFSATFGL